MLDPILGRPTLFLVLQYLRPCCCCVRVRSSDLFSSENSHNEHLLFTDKKNCLVFENTCNYVINGEQ